MFGKSLSLRYVWPSTAKLVPSESLARRRKVRAERRRLHARQRRHALEDLIEEAPFRDGIGVRRRESDARSEDVGRS